MKNFLDPVTKKFFTASTGDLNVDPIPCRLFPSRIPNHNLRVHAKCYCSIFRCYDNMKLRNVRASTYGNKIYIYIRTKMYKEGCV
jgi:hypothetical protein